MGCSEPSASYDGRRHQNDATPAWDDTCRLQLGAACCTLAKLPKRAIKRTPMRTPLPLSSEAISTRQETSMGLTHASLRLTNTFTGASVEVEALVDSGAMP